jgi:hypothetical protein
MDASFRSGFRMLSFVSIFSFFTVVVYWISAKVRNVTTYKGNRVFIKKIEDAGCLLSLVESIHMSRLKKKNENHNEDEENLFRLLTRVL